ncbi:Uncharacterised protein [Yersinia similis]|nr:Uncharacterised protein [Yersinia similis]
MKVVLRPSFDIPVILLNQVIQIVVLPDGDDFFIGFVGVECSQRCRVGTTFINGTTAGSPWCRMALRKKRNAAAASSLAVSRTSMVWPAVSTARYRYF